MKQLFRGNKNKLLNKCWINKAVTYIRNALNEKGSFRRNRTTSNDFLPYENSWDSSRADSQLRLILDKPSFRDVDL